MNLKRLGNPLKKVAILLAVVVLPVLPVLTGAQTVTNPEAEIPLHLDRQQKLRLTRNICEPTMNEQLPGSELPITCGGEMGGISDSDNGPLFLVMAGGSNIDLFSDSAESVQFRRAMIFTLGKHLSHDPDGDYKAQTTPKAFGILVISKSKVYMFGAGQLTLWRTKFLSLAVDFNGAWKAIRNETKEYSTNTENCPPAKIRNYRVGVPTPENKWSLFYASFCANDATPIPTK